MKQRTAEIVKQVVAVLSALLLFFGTINLQFDWFTEESINAFGLLLGALIALAITIKGIYDNHFAQMKAFTKADEKKEERFKEEGIEFKRVEEPAVTVGEPSKDEERTKGELK